MSSVKDFFPIAYTNWVVTVSEPFDKTGKIEAQVSADEDLKLSDLLKYYLRESQAAKVILFIVF